ncbi:hypothetical protein Hanom_Chr00s014639g01753101 [Helianthus anomalus]
MTISNRCCCLRSNLCSNNILPIPMLTPNSVHELKGNSFGLRQENTNNGRHERRHGTVEEEQTIFHRT